MMDGWVVVQRSNKRGRLMFLSHFDELMLLWCKRSSCEGKETARNTA